MRAVTPFLLGLLAVSTAAGPTGAQQGPPPKQKWLPLFNGKDLKGWIPKVKGRPLGENHADTFRVENGVLKVAYDKYTTFDERFGHLAYHKPFSSYRLRFEYRFVGQQCPGGPDWAFRNSGVMLHGQSPESMSKDQNFPISLELQLLGGRESGERHTANLCTPGTNVVIDGKLVTRHCIDSSSKTYRGDAWVPIEVEVHGSGIVKHLVDGQPVLTYSQPQLDERDAEAKKRIKDGHLLLEGGYLYLQAESHPVEFRKIELLELETPPATRPAGAPAPAGQLDRR